MCFRSKELLRGPTFYVLALIATTLAAWRASPVAALVVALMCGGDGLADIAGRRWGGKGRLPWNGAKSWAGSAAMFLGERDSAGSKERRREETRGEKKRARPSLEPYLSTRSPLLSSLPFFSPPGGSAMAAAIIALFTRCGYFTITPPSAAATAIATTALVATVAESLPLNRWVDDNVSVPALAALVGWWLLRPV